MSMHMDDDKPSKKYISEYLAKQMVDDYMDEVDEKHRKIPYNWKDILWQCKCGSDRFEEKERLIICLRCSYNYEIDVQK
jgi:hypothetical protein